MGLEDGREATRYRIEDAHEAGVQCECVFKLIGQGNFVVSYSKPVTDDEAVAVFDIWRLSEGRIVAVLPIRAPASTVYSELATPVVETIGSEAKSRFTGRIPKVTIEVEEAPDAR